MDEKQALILDTKGGELKNITSRVKEIEDTGSKFEITFDQGKTYSYKKTRVKYFDKPEPICLSRFIVYLKDGGSRQWDSVIQFDAYFCLFWGQSSIIRRADDVEIIENIAAKEETKHLREYYRYIVGLLNDKTPHLAIYYDQKLKEIRKDSVLQKFIDRTEPQSYECEGIPIFPFGINPSQRRAVINALESQVSLIQGPPGTGKTQTILNIVANLVIRGKTVAIVAGNNSATANVYEKLERVGIGFIAAKLGNNDRQTEFFSTTSDIPDVSSWLVDSEDRDSLKQRLNEISDTITELLEAKNQLALVKETLARLKIERHYFERNFGTQTISPEDWSFANKWSTPNLLKFMAELEYHSKEGYLRWPVKLSWLYRYRIFRFRDLNRLDSSVYRVVVGEFYKKKIEELDSRQKSLEVELAANDFETLFNQYTAVSESILRDSIARHYQSSVGTEFNAENYKRNFDKFLRRFPVVLSTTDSIINNKEAPALFDYLIVDEASQVDLLTGFLAMACAKNIVAVGDLKQLPHIADTVVSEEGHSVDVKFDIQAGYSYSNDSLLSSLNTVFSESAPSVLLKEHYRCHPRIIDFCNQKFYDGELIVMTELSGDAFKVIKTTPGNHARPPSNGKSLQNVRELDVIAQELLKEDLKNVARNKIGITTPYRAQADKAQQYINEEGLQIDTVYKYQGREKDVVIFSTTASRLNKFVDDPHLLNVVVSRAIEQFILVTSKDSFKKQGSNIGDLIRHIEYQSLSDSIFESTTVSIFDCLYKEYADVLKEFSSNLEGDSRYPSENLMEALLKEILEEEDYRSFAYQPGYSLVLLINDHSQLTERETKFVKHPRSHVDFLVYNKLDKLPILAIEVDGYKFHELNAEQRERDRVKDAIFQKVRIPLIRFSTVGSNEKEKLKSVMDQVLEVIPESEDEQLVSTSG